MSEVKVKMIFGYVELQEKRVLNGSALEFWVRRVAHTDGDPVEYGEWEMISSIPNYAEAMCRYSRKGVIGRIWGAIFDA